MRIRSENSVFVCGIVKSKGFNNYNFAEFEATHLWRVTG
jgi:hypothetical protein